MRIRTPRARKGALIAMTRLALAGLAAVLFMACNKGKDNEATPLVETIPPLFPVAAASPSSITAGQSCTLYWLVTSATNKEGTVAIPTTLSIDQGIGPVELSGSVTVKPTVTTTYTFTAVYAAGTIPGTSDQHAGGANSTSVTINVVPPVDGSLSLFAGMPAGRGNMDGAAGGAVFGNPTDLVADGDGSVFITDSMSHTIRKLSSAGQVSTFAGLPGQSGYGDGSGLAVTFNNPSSIALDPAGNLVVADTGNNTIRMITPAGVVSTLAGKGGVLSGSTNGIGQKARFNAPYGLAVAGDGTIYVADSYNCTLRKIAPTPKDGGGVDYVVTTLAGTAGLKGSADGTGSAARFLVPTGLAVDGDGNVYVADYGAHTIRKVTPAGVVTTLAGLAGSAGTANGAGSVARFNQPYKLALDANGDLLVADHGNNAIRKVLADGTVSTYAGLPGTDSAGSEDGNVSEARFRQPIALAVAAGDVFVADSGNQVIRKIAAGTTVSTVAGSTSHSGNLDGAGFEARFLAPKAAVVDSTGVIYVSDSGNNCIRKITPEGLVSTFVGAGGNLLEPEGMALDALGNLYVADTGNHVIKRVTSAGVVSTFAGTAGLSGTTDGTGAAARFNEPTGLALDGGGNLYVADYGNHAIRLITSAGEVSTLAGKIGVAGGTNGVGTNSYFRHPRSLALDPSGNLYVADMDNNAIRKITPDKGVTTFAGTIGLADHKDDVNASAYFYLPCSIVRDGSGTLWVADLGNNAIRKVTTDAETGHVTTPVGLAGRKFNATGTLPSSLNAPSWVAVDPVTGNLFITVPDAVLKVTF